MSNQDDTREFFHHSSSQILNQNDVSPTDTTAQNFLLQSEIKDAWLHPEASNYTFVVKLEMGNLQSHGIYKPERGEAPLWDFPSGLYKREYAAYLVSNYLGWELVPPTVLRVDEAIGYGSLQLFVPPVYGSNFFSLRDDYSENLRLIALFDWVTNNADRKGGHCFLAKNGGVWAVDNGLSFHEEHKLRTVIWDFAEQELYPWMLNDLTKLELELNQRDSKLLAQLLELLEESEIESFKNRIRNILNHPFFPKPQSRRDIPWPII